MTLFCKAGKNVIVVQLHVCLERCGSHSKKLWFTQQEIVSINGSLSFSFLHTVGSVVGLSELLDKPLFLC